MSVRGSEFVASLPFVIIPMLISIGQLLFKRASQTTGLIPTPALAALLSNPFLVVALTIYFIATLWWVVALRSAPLAYAYVFMALSFVYVPLLSWLLLKEQIGLRALVGSGLIVMGIAIAALDRSAMPTPSAAPIADRHD